MVILFIFFDLSVVGATLLADRYRHPFAKINSNSAALHDALDAIFRIG